MLTDKYISWLKDNFKEKNINENITEISTPFLNRHNDHIVFYAEYLDDEQLLLTDGGETINDLELSGMDINTPKRKQILQTIINRLGLHLNKDDNSIYVNTDISKFAKSKHNLIQGILAIDDMFYVSSSYVTSLFLEDVKEFFDMNNIFYTEGVKFTGKSGVDHSYDFILQRNKTNPERLIKLMNQPSTDKMGVEIFSWDDIKSSRRDDAKLIVLLNDSEKTSSNKISSIINGLNEYDIDSILWSKRDEHLLELA